MPADPRTASGHGPFRALATPIVDMVRPILYTEMYPPEDPSYHPLAINHTMFVGGAMARVPPDARAIRARTRISWATKVRRASAPHIRALRGIDWSRSSVATTRPTCSG
jgi:hypothetical protein